MKKKLRIITISIFTIIALFFLLLPNKKEKVKEEIVSVNLEEKETKEEIKEEKIIPKKVEIKGEVNNPGVYEFNDNERVIDLINKANGLKENANTNLINLSKKLKDEMVVIIYSNEELEEQQNFKYKVINIECECPDTLNEACIEEKKEENEEKTEEKTLIININEATIEELMTLPSIGEAKAKKIIEYRENNQFNDIEDIKNVSGIGDSLFEKIKDFISI